VVCGIFYELNLNGVRAMNFQIKNHVTRGIIFECDPFNEMACMGHPFCLCFAIRLVSKAVAKPSQTDLK
jgi:hypothetical protein